MSDPTKESETPSRSAHGVAYEHKDLSARSIAWTVIALFIMIIGVYIACIISEAVLKTRWKENSGSLPTAHELPPEPRLEVEGPAGLRDLREHENQLLNHYAWVDPAHGVVRIPIARAMELVAERGLPAQTENKKQ